MRRGCEEEEASLAGKINSGEPAKLTLPALRPASSHAVSLIAPTGARLGSISLGDGGCRQPPRSRYDGIVPFRFHLRAVADGSRSSSLT